MVPMPSFVTAGITCCTFSTEDSSSGTISVDSATEIFQKLDDLFREIEILLSREDKWRWRGLGCHDDNAGKSPLGIVIAETIDVVSMFTFFYSSEFWRNCDQKLR